MRLALSLLLTLLISGTISAQDSRWYRFRTEGEYKRSPAIEFSDNADSVWFRITLDSTTISESENGNLSRAFIGADSLAVPSEKLRHSLFLRKDSTIELAIELNAPPDTNCFSYHLESSGLTFWYQPALTDEEINSGVERPDSVVGSYAVYHASGKAYHIYRPKAWDSRGDTVWCDMQIDSRAHQLTVTVPQEFLKRSAYPVVVDPTIGRSDIGASASNINTNQCVAQLTGTRTAESGERAVAIYWYGKTYGTDADIGGAIYTIESGRPVNRVTSEISITDLFSDPTAQWYHVDIDQSLTEGTEYTVAIRGRSSGALARGYFDNVASSSEFLEDQIELPSVWTGTANTKRFSFYVETEFSTAESETLLRRRTILEAIL